ncbi:MAG: AbrB/MazE/SpoVT family DNA-binding domain-containing protein [Pseudomonadota bacterium]
MNEYRTKLSEDGRVVIPAACRKYLHLKAGEEIIIRVEDHELRLLSLRHSLRKAQALVKSYSKGKSLVKALIDLRKEDNKNE